MKSKNIKFAKELCFNAILDDAESRIGLGLVDFQVPKDDLLIKISDDEYARLDIAAEEETVINELHISYGRSLLRVDKIVNSHITLTLLAFSEAQFYDIDNPLRIIVDQALAADLRANDIAQENAVEELRKQIIVDEGVKYCFAYGRGDGSGNLEIVGERYSFVISETPQHYLHITQMRHRANKNRIDYPIIIIKGIIEIVNELTDRAILTARADEQYSKLVSSDSEFIELWNIYNELEIESIKQQAIEMGYLKYKSFKYANGMIVFSLEGGYTRREFCVDNMYYVAIANINLEAPMDYNSRSAIIIGTEIDFKCVNTSEFRIKEDMDTSRSIPLKGYLLPSIAGSEIQSKRRKKAQLNILSNKCQLPGLKNILQGGAQAGVIGRQYQAISSDMEEKIFESRDLHFTERQKQALNIAINTPDIAIIQGPPGTGKTKVIKAIIKRIDEIWDSKAKILIASTQHDAVDNVAEGIDYGGVPVNRVSIRKGKEKDNWLINDWIDNMITSCETWITKNGGSERGIVREVFEKLIQIEEAKDWTDCLYHLKDCYMLIHPLNLSLEIERKFPKVIAEVSAKITVAKPEAENQLRLLLSTQRLNTVAYLDDGILQLKLLERYLKYDNDFEYEIPEYWSKLKKTTEDCDDLNKYLQMLKIDCEKLADMCPDFEDVNTILLERDINELTKMVRMELLSRGNDKNVVLINLIWEFKQELTNSNNVEQLVKAYSKINAATCQQSANPHLSASMGGFDEVYDYVIVDEAARSNPLDLLIPMCMGKKIILVGDHKQLPHMVEKDVVLAVAKRSEERNVESVLEESLFMRLYDSVAREDKKLGISRTAMLNEQYRMHPDICDLVNVFYNGNLETMCKREEKEHGLGLYDDKALAWIDLPLSEEYPSEIKRQSISRQCEIDRIQEELSKILTRNTDYKIGIITFYSTQAKLLNDMVQKNFPGDVDRIRVGTVDAFQGKEFDIVLLSVVRSNMETEPRKRVGFLDNDNRLCVALSRAKRLLIAVGDSKTVAYDGEKQYVRALHEFYTKCQ